MICGKQRALSLSGEKRGWRSAEKLSSVLGTSQNLAKKQTDVYHLKVRKSGCYTLLGFCCPRQQFRLLRLYNCTINITLHTCDTQQPPISKFHPQMRCSCYADLLSSTFCWFHKTFHLAHHYIDVEIKGRTVYAVKWVTEEKLSKGNQKPSSFLWSHLKWTPMQAFITDVEK